MTSPKYAVATEQGRFYILPGGESFPSVTNVLDKAVNKPVLVPWAAKITAESFWDRLPEAVVASLRGDEARASFLREVKGQVRVVKDTAADLGSRIHAIAEAELLGKPYAADPEAAPFVQQFIKFLAAFRIDIQTDIEAAEATIVNRTAGYAGTGDIWAWLHLSPDLQWCPDERFLWLLDIKTSKTRSADSTYPEQGIQLAALAHGETVLLSDGTEVPCPAPIVGTAILNLRARSHRLIPMPADRDAAFRAFCGALAVANYMYGLSGDPVAVPAPTAEPTTEKASA